MSKCLIGATCISQECVNCSNFDYQTSIEIRIFNNKTGRAEYKILRKSQLDTLRKVLNLKAI